MRGIKVSVGVIENREEVLSALCKKVSLIKFAVQAGKVVLLVELKHACEECGHARVFCIQLNARTEDDPYWMYLHVCLADECKRSVEPQEGREHLCPVCFAREEGLEDE